MEKKVLDYNSLASLRPGEKLTIGAVEVKRAGIVWVVKSGDVRRSFEKAPVALEWINKELEKAVVDMKQLKKTKKIDVVVEQANGKAAVVGTIEKSKAEIKAMGKVEKIRAKNSARALKEEIKEHNITEKRQAKLNKKLAQAAAKKTRMEQWAEKHAAKIAKRAEIKARRARNKVRKFFEYVIFTFSWILFMAAGFVMFDIYQLPFFPAELGTAITAGKDLIHGVLADNTLFTAVYAGLAALGVMVLLFSLTSIQLQKTKFAKVWGLMLTTLGVAGTGYALFVNFPHLADLFTNLSSVNNIIKLSFLVVAVLQPVLVLLVGRKAKAGK